MINDAPFPGGECLWRGCIPSKAWRAAADRIRDRVHDEHLGIEGTHRAATELGTDSKRPAATCWRRAATWR